MLKKNIKKTGNKNSGFTLIEALVVLFIFSLITMTFYELYSVGLRHIQNSKNRLGALAIANEKMEIIRNLNYDNIGTVSGAVSGNLPEDEDIAENAGVFHVHTVVEYVQDSLDGVYPTDAAWEDYKKVTITVSWSGGQQDVSLTSRFVPAGLEVANPGDGILLVNVFSDQPGGSGIPNTSVHVVNSETGLNTTVETDSTGSLAIMGDKIQNSIQKYQITITKSGYETVNTLPPYPTTSYNPVDVHASVVTGAINVVNIVQNELATLSVSTVDYLNQSIADIAFNLNGGRKMGNEAVDPFTPVYSLNSDTTTNASGEKDFGSVSPGQYVFTIAPSVTDYVLIDTDPVSPITLFSNQTLDIKVKLADKNTTSLLVRVVSNADGNPPVAGAQVQLINGLGYDVTQTTSATGTVFFPVTADEFIAGDYHIKITADGFTDFENDININANELKIESITLTAT